MSSFRHRNLFFVAFFYWLVYATAELVRPGLVSTYLDLYFMFALLFMYGCWIVVTQPEDSANDRRLPQILLVCLASGAILYAVSLSGMLGATLSIVVAFLVFTAFYLV